MQGNKIGILFAGEEQNVCDAISHLLLHDELYWSIPVKIKVNKYTLPMDSYLCVKGKNIAYKCRIKEIMDFHSSHFDEKCKKPLRWIARRKSGQTKRNYKYTLLITKISKQTIPITNLKKYNGRNITRTPQGIANIEI